MTSLDPSQDEATADSPRDKEGDPRAALRAALAGLGLSIGEFSRLSGIGRRTVIGWHADGPPTPEVVWLLIEAWQASPALLKRQRNRLAARQRASAPARPSTPLP
jgi:hypothetical protein